MSVEDRDEISLETHTENVNSGIFGMILQLIFHLFVFYMVQFFNKHILNFLSENNPLF